MQAVLPAKAEDLSSKKAWMEDTTSHRGLRSE